MSVCMLCGSLSAGACQKTYSILYMKLHQNIEKNGFSLGSHLGEYAKAFATSEKILPHPYW